MDLSPLYDLRDRLRAGAIAGAALVLEDFRLKRALDALAPLEQASPVFAKLGQLTRALLDPGCTDRAGALLDALTLADAVLCTQGAVAAPGALEPVETANQGDAVTNAPYSVLSPLLEALTTSGSGKYSFVLDTHNARPELFADYRVKNAMVQALGAAYSELADKVAEWLSQEDASLLPMLQNGFDPKGKKDMVRRVQVMSAVAGAEANEYYLAQLPEAEKEVRAALIYALRLDEGNAEKLVELCKTEKGSCKKMAHWALAKLESPIAWDYWDKLAAKKPDQAAEYMTLAATEKASALVAGALGRWLAPYEADPDTPLAAQEQQQLYTLFSALPGKSGPEICDCYRRMAALGTALDQKHYKNEAGQSIAVQFRLLTTMQWNPRELLPFSAAVPLVLQQSILYHPAPDLLALAEELAQTAEVSYAVPVLTAALLTKPAADVYELAKPVFHPSLSIFKKPEQRAGKRSLIAAFGLVKWDGDTQSQVLTSSFVDPALNGPPRFVQRPIREPLDRRLYDDLLGMQEDVMWVLFGLIPENDRELCAYLGERLYRRALTLSNNCGYLAPLVRCGFTQCAGLAVRYFQSQRRINVWEVQRYFSQMPGDNAARVKELEQIIEMIKLNNKKFQTGSLIQLKQWLLDLKNAAPIAL